MELVNGLINKISGWIDKVFGYADFYTSNYSKLLVYALLIWVGAKMMKLKLDVSTGKGKR